MYQEEGSERVEVDDYSGGYIHDILKLPGAMGHLRMYVSAISMRILLITYSGYVCTYRTNNSCHKKQKANNKLIIEVTGNIKSKKRERRKKKKKRKARKITDLTNY